jgi:Rrf2 family nitric oxide-sensitive transcriptional repressor
MRDFGASAEIAFYLSEIDRTMRLTAYTDYALRTLMYLATNRDRLVTIQDIADLHDISKNHLTKVVNHLGQLGLVETLRGRNGGLKLGKEPADINIGKVVRQTESDFFMAVCFDRNNNSCPYTAACTLKNVLGAATDAYLKVLDDVTLENLIKKPGSRAGNGTVSKPIRFQAEAKARRQ